MPTELSKQALTGGEALDAIGINKWQTIKGEYYLSFIAYI